MKDRVDMSHRMEIAEDLGKIKSTEPLRLSTRRVKESKLIRRISMRMLTRASRMPRTCVYDNSETRLCGNN